MIASIARSSPLRAAAITASSPVSRQTRGCICRAAAAFDLDTVHLRPGEGNLRRRLDYSQREGQVHLEVWEHSAWIGDVKRKNRGYWPRRRRSSASRTAGSTESPIWNRCRDASTRGAGGGGADIRSMYSRALIACTPPPWATCRSTESDDPPLTSRSPWRRRA